MVCRRTKVQGVVRFDERFGLGTKFLTCGEEEIWLEDAFRAKLQMRYFPIKTVETSTMLKNPSYISMLVYNAVMVPIPIIGMVKKHGGYAFNLP